jgi:hypothetical protein
VDIERLQLRSLAIEQQLSLIRVKKLYQEYQLCKFVASPPPHRQANTPALLQPEDRCPTPHALNEYQEASLAEQPPSRSEDEDLVRIQRISSRFCDVLVQRWTKLEEIERQLNELKDTSSRGPLLLPAPMDPRRRAQQPTVESETEEDEVPRIKVPNPRLSTPGPVIMHMDEIDEHTVSSPRTFSSPIGIPTPTSPSNLRPPGQSPRSFSGSPINPFFPASPTQSRPMPRRSPGPSPLSSPRSSFSNVSVNSDQQTTRSSFSNIPVSNDQPTPRPTAAFKTGYTTTSPKTEATPVQQPQPPQKPAGIPWRLRRQDRYWDYIDNTCVDANTSKAPPEAAQLDRNIVTEIFDRWVRREALDEAQLDYRRVSREPSDSRWTKFETCWIIQRALSYSDVKQLHRRTLELDRRDLEREQARAERHRRSRPAPLTRSYTTPAPLQIPHSPAANSGGIAPRFPASPSVTEHHRTGSNILASPSVAEHHRTGSSSSYNRSHYSPRSSHSSPLNTDSDSESDESRRRQARSRSRARSKSRSRSYSVKGDDRSRSKSYSVKGHDRSSKGSASKKDKKRGENLAKIGLAGVVGSTLLEGLPDLLAGL